MRSLVVLAVLVSFVSNSTFARDRVGNGDNVSPDETEMTPGDKTGNGTPLAQGDRVGNGGFGVSCVRPTSTFEVEALDIFELRMLGRTPVQISYSFGFENVILQMGEILLKSMNEELATDIRREVVFLARAIRGETASRLIQSPHVQDGPNKYTVVPLVKFVEGVSVLPKYDTGSVIPLPLGCRKVGVIAQYRLDQAFDQQTFYEIDLGLWNEMDEVSQAALILHEVLFREVLRRDPRATSATVRELVGIVFTREGQSTSAKRVDALLKRAGLK